MSDKNGEAVRPRVIDADQIVIRDYAGNVRIRLGMDPEAPDRAQIAVLDESGVVRAEVSGGGVTDYGYVSVAAPNGLNVAMNAMDSGASLGIHNGDDQTLCDAHYMADTKETWLVFCDEDHETNISFLAMGRDATGETTFSMSTRHGEPILRLRR